MQSVMNFRLLYSCLPVARPFSHGRLSRRRIIAQRQTAGLPCHDDCEISVAVTSEILSLSSLKMNAQYNAITGRDYCCVGPKRAEKEREIRRKMGVHTVICDRRNNGLFWTIFEDMRRDEAKFLNYFRMSVDS